MRFKATTLIAVFSVSRNELTDVILETTFEVSTDNKQTNKKADELIHATSFINFFFQILAVSNVTRDSAVG
jgi:hypothetical protein